MRKLSAILFLLALSAGCNIFESEDEHTVVKDFDVVNTEIVPGEEYIHNLGALGDEEQATIKEDSRNASISELFYDFNGTAVVKYRYRPKPGFTGEDTVVLEMRRGSDGESRNTDIYYTVINFNIRE
ncbi:hypothetical protein [Rhodohalobacter sulfatireducens]|uniref:Lipoprotein n=1 Tax=Rhodohalobacter sulfatireducens TaxID=2911366 RepID=A0ABS9KG10_9BACT|nr:hypothetical protein [Rhodohalobacter sulfatireducens]MCG2589732.1 hypothetical protein [Rhodohalobacter sulfatireducens]